MGIKPDIIVLRSSRRLEKSIFEKIASFCNTSRECVIENRNATTLYEIPLMLERQHLSDIVTKSLNLSCPGPDLEEWKAMVDRIKHPKKKLTVGIVGKYVKFHDCYLSLTEALHHAGYSLETEIHIKWIDAETLEEGNVEERLQGCDAIIVPGGFGYRGVEGMILAARYCREKGVPYLGICLGMQIAVIEFARNVAGLKEANSREFDPASPHKVIDFLPDQNEGIDLGGTLRLGSYPCHLSETSLIRSLYQSQDIQERHRHRYEFNNDYRDILSSRGLVLSGTSPDGRIVETIETGDGFFIGVQFHPEFKSRPNRPHPLFVGLVDAGLKHSF